jgi:hypothetical protein
MYVFLYFRLVQGTFNEYHGKTLRTRERRLLETRIKTVKDFQSSNGDEISTAKSAEVTAKPEGVWRECVQGVDTQSINRENLADMTKEAPRVDTDDVAEVRNDRPSVFVFVCDVLQTHHLMTTSSCV